jgi:hypothetical protein
LLCVNCLEKHDYNVPCDFGKKNCIYTDFSKNHEEENKIKNNKRLGIEITYSIDISSDPVFELFRGLEK